MSDIPFKALVVRENEDKTYKREVLTRRTGDLPPGDVLVKVHYSSLNYKDALSCIGNKGVTREYPHTPGIDAAGVVVESQVPAFKEGNEVIVTSYDLGMNTDGGFGQYIRVPVDWIVPLPPGLGLKESMMYGTAGLTAGLAVRRLQTLEITPGAGEILVTGATGGVGSMACAVLARLGYTVCGVSGKKTAPVHLARWGVTCCLDRAEATDTSKRPLLKSRWAGVIDTVGGGILTTAVKMTRPYGAVVCCGNAASGDLPLTVYPFILRGLTISGISSQNTPMAPRRAVWEKLAGAWRPQGLAEIIETVGLNDLGPRIDAILQGGITGRCLVDLQA